MEDVSLWMKKVTRDRLMTVQTDVIQLVPSLVLLVLNMVNNAAQWVQLGVTTTLMDSQLTSHNKASRHLQKTSENFWHHFWCFRCIGLCLAPDQHRCIMGHVIEKTWICVCVCVCVCVCARSRCAVLACGSGCFCSGSAAKTVCLQTLGPPVRTRPRWGNAHTDKHRWGVWQVCVSRQVLYEEQTWEVWSWLWLLRLNMKRIFVSQLLSGCLADAFVWSDWQ